MGANEIERIEWMRGMLARIPVAGLIGAKPVSWDAEEQRAVIEFAARPEFCNLMGTVQGGLLTAMLDMAMAFAVLCGLDDGWVVPSLEIKTSYVAPARPGPLFGEGHVVRCGRTIVFMEGRIIGPDGRLIATGTATGQLRQLARPD
jgi:uncharacterized protein (TIGR00369 family)